MERTLDTIMYFFKDNEARYSKDTVRGYGIALKQFFSFIEKEFDTVKRGDIRKWHASLDEKGLMVRSIRLKLAALGSFYKYLMEENLIKKNPTVNLDLPRLDDSLPKYLTKIQLAQLFELANGDLMGRVIVEMLYSTGVRISELLNMKKSDVKWDTRQIWITKGKGNKERFVLFTQECAERLKVHLRDTKINSTYIFANTRGNPLSRYFVEVMFQNYSKVLGFRVTPHTMRHSMAAHLSEKGMPLSYVQDLLGHKNINTTRIYTRLSNDDRKKQYDNYQ